MTDQELITALLAEESDLGYHAAVRLRTYMRVERAWNDPGRYPVFHETAKNRLRERWSALGNTLDALTTRSN